MTKSDFKVIPPKSGKEVIKHDFEFRPRILLIFVLNNNLSLMRCACEGDE